MRINHIGRKLVWVFNSVWAAIVGLIFLTPYLAHIGSPVAKYLYLLFRPTCHQRPERSFFLWGHKMAACARCTGTYISLLLWGVVFGIILRFRKIKALPLWGFAFLLLPTAIDGGTQLIGLRKSTNILRLITGILSGLAVVWFVYPQIYLLEEEQTLSDELAYSGEKTSLGQG
ncbi:DUF2085 domain-containing protein [bacterium]|nr:DUF2085 domain-containing protein [bacterium]